MSDIPRKNGWQLAEQAREKTPYGMQRLLSQAVWDQDGVRDEIRTFALQTLGNGQVIIAIDETGFLKRGKHSAGEGRAALRPDGRSAQLPDGRLPLAGHRGGSYPHRPGAVSARLHG